MIAKNIIKVKVDLTSPLLILKSSKGFLACGYISIETCNKLGDTAAIVTGVSDFDDMLGADICAVSLAAKDLGAYVGMSGKDFLALLG